MSEEKTVPEVIVVEKKKTIPKPVPVPVPSVQPIPPVPVVPVVPVESKYKLHLYAPNGLLRADIARGVYADFSRRYGDIMRAIHSSNWQTMPEILTAYKNLTKRLKFDTTRNSEQICTAVEEMVTAGLVLKR